MATRQGSLDSLRGVAILMVVVGHFSQPLGGVLSSKVFDLGIHGVDLFFALSGCLIGGILLENKGSEYLLRTFYARRAIRILPVYALLLVSYFIVRAVDNRTKFGLIVELHMPAGTGWSYLLLLQNNVMAFMGTLSPAWLLPTWSLAIEEQFYLLAPWIVGRLPTRTVTVICLAAVVGCPLVRYAFATHGMGLCAALLLISRMDTLCVGILVAIAWEKGWLHGASHRWLGPAAVVLGSFTLWSTCQMEQALASTSAGVIWVLAWQPSLWAIEAMLVLAYLVTLPSGNRVGLLASAGRTSYFIYLFHLPAIIVATAVAGKLGVNYLIIGGGSMLLLWILAEISWAGLEKPTQDFGRAKFEY